METGKIGALFLVSVMALAGISAGYAAWTDTVTVQGTVNTASVDLQVVDYSGTDAWKVWGTCPGVPDDELIVWEGTLDDRITDEYDFLDMLPGINPDLDNNGELIAWAWAVPGEGDYDIDVSYQNLFPCVDFVADAVFHYGQEDSIPAKINDISYEITEGSEWIMPLIDQGDIWAEAYLVEEIEGEWVPIDETGSPCLPEDAVPVDEGYQLHYCDHFKVDLHIHIPQDDAYESVNGAFTASIEVVQWNEYPYGE